MADLRAVSIEPGALGVAAVLADIRRAVLGDGEPIALLAAGPEQLRARSLEAVAIHDPVDPDTAVVITTSGSTGQPRGVELSRTALRASVDACHSYFLGPGRWVTAMPAHHVGGLMTVVRSIVAGFDPVVHDGVGGAAAFTAEDFAVTTALAYSKSHGEPLYVSLTPTHLDRLIREPVGIAALARYGAVLSGAAATPPELLVTLQRNGIRVARSYGMTETCGGVVYDGKPIAGVEIGIAAGRVRVTGPMVARGYRGPAHLSEGVFSTTDQGVPSMLTADLGSFDNGVLTVTGRADDVVQVGGQSVDLAAVTAVFRSLPGVVDAVVVAVPDREWGSVPMALVVGAIPASFDVVIGQQLGRAAVPRTCRVVDDLPRLASGKVDRLAAIEIGSAY